MDRSTKRLTAEARREVIERAATEVFAERGYQAASIDEIARRSGVSAPVVYDHFSSKQDLHGRLLERHFADLREVWRVQLGGDEPQEERIARAFDAWFAYVESHPFAWRMLFRDTTGDPEVQAEHRAIADRSRAMVLHLLAREAGGELLADQESLELAWELVRAALQGLALWWYDHRNVPRAQIVATAMNFLWIGMDRLGSGERWPTGRAE
jgi:AcrR family transcriptional regulator